jgi:peptide/nickel transport system substrate-binding protein
MLYARNGHPSYLLGWGGATFDADGTFFPLLRTKQVLSHFTHPPLDVLIDEARSIMDKKKRLELYKQANKIFQEEVPWAFAYQQLDIYGVSDRLNWKSRGDEKIFVYNMSFKK